MREIIGTRKGGCHLPVPVPGREIDANSGEANRSRRDMRIPVHVEFQSEVYELFFSNSLDFLHFSNLLATRSRRST